MLFVPRPLSDAIEKAAQEWKSKAEAGKPHQMVVAAAQHGLRLCWLASMRLWDLPHHCCKHLMTLKLVWSNLCRHRRCWDHSPTCTVAHSSTVSLRNPAALGRWINFLVFYTLCACFLKIWCQWMCWMSRAQCDLLLVLGDGVRFGFSACPQYWREFWADGVSWGNRQVGVGLSHQDCSLPRDLICSKDVRCQEHDVRCWPSPRPLLDCCGSLPWTYVDQGSGRTNAQRSEQELVILCWMDPQQHQGIRVRHPTKGIEDGRSICWQFYSDPGDVQASSRSMARCFFMSWLDGARKAVQLKIQTYNKTRNGMELHLFHSWTKLRNTSLPCSAARQDRDLITWSLGVGLQELLSCTLSSEIDDDHNSTCHRWSPCLGFGCLGHFISHVELFATGGSVPTHVVFFWHFCSAARPSCTGTPVRVWMRWSSLRPSPTWMIWSLSTSSTKMLLLKRRVNSTRRRANMTDEPGHEESVSGKSGQFSPASLDIADNSIIKRKRPKRAAVWPDHPSCKSRQDKMLKNLTGSKKFEKRYCVPAGIPFLFLSFMSIHFVKAHVFLDVFTFCSRSEIWLTYLATCGVSSPWVPMI